MKHALTCLFLLAACTPKPAQQQSGTRLTALAWDVRTSPFGATFYDKTLGIYCTFEWVKGDEYRCVPLGFERAFFGVEYADSACSARRAYAYKRCGNAPTPKYVDIYAGLGNDENGCRVKQFASLGAAASASTYQKFAGGMCTASGDSTDTVRAWFEVGADVSLSTFVKATAKPAAFGSRYTATKLTAEDGSTVMLYNTLYDTTTDTLCQFTRIDGTSPETRCTPVADYGAFYTSSTCTTVAVNHSPPDNAACVEPGPAKLKADRVFVSTQVIASCTSTQKYFVGKPGTVPMPAFEWVNGTCAQSNGAPGPSGLYVSDTALDSATFGKATYEKGGSGRLQDVTWKVEGGESVALPGYFYDTTLQTFCRPAYADGKPRCLPEITNGAGVYFKDAACTQAVVREFDAGLGASCKKPPTGFAHLVDFFCPTTARVFRIGTTSQMLASVYYRDDKGACVEQLTPDNYYDATELHAADLAEVDEASPKLF